jgi:hypothetical protein
LLAARRKGAPSAEGSGQTVIDARSALDRLQLGLLPPEFVSRLYDRRDLDFVMACTPPEVQRRFLAERKRIALEWVGRVRKEIVELRRFHTEQSRLHANIGVRSELALAFDFASFLMVCRPYGVQGVVHWTTAAADRLCTISEKSLDVLAARVNVRRETGSVEVAS